MYFIIFMVCSELYMVLTCLLLKDHKRRLTTPMEQLAYKKKVSVRFIYLFFYSLLFLSSPYLFISLQPLLETHGKSI